MCIYLVDIVKCIMFFLPNEFNGSTRHSAMCSELKVTMLGLTSEITAICEYVTFSYYVTQFLLLCH